MSIIRNGFQDVDLDVPVVLPTLNLDFANSQKLDPRITFSRGSIGTFVNKNGLIETAAANIPRFDYDPVTGECKGLLIEESRQNLLTNSNDFTVWTKQTTGTGLVGITTNASTSPDGTTNATRYFIQNGGGTFYSIYRGVTGILANTSYSYSMFVKGSTTVPVPAFSFSLVIFDGSISSSVTYNLNTGTIQSTFQNTNFTIGSGSTIINYGNGWYRCVFVFSHSVGGNEFQFKADIGGTRHNQELFIYGAQLEKGEFPTSYIPTSGSTVTRSAEIAEMTGTNFSSWYNQTEGIFFFDGTLPFITNDTLNRVPYGVSNGYNFSNSIYVSKTATSLGLSFSIINNNVSQSTGTSLPNMTSSRFKIASSVADKNIYSCGYGGSVNKHSRPSAAIPTVNRLTLGKEPWNLSTLNPMIGTIRKFAYYPKALSPAQLQYLTQ